MIKKITALLICCAVAAAGLASCGKKEKVRSEKLNIVCTIFPEYDWTKEILGSHAEDAEITYLLDNGVDLHSYQPSAKDMVTISECDLFIYVGGESDTWVEDALKNAQNEKMQVIDLMEVMGSSAKEEEFKEGMMPEEEEEGEEGEEEPEYDEHVWLSLRNAEVFCVQISNALCSLDKANAEDYKANLDAYLKKLEELDTAYSTLAASAATSTLVFCDRFPFRYFVDDYGFKYYAAFVGCSAETEASFETISFLAQKIDELGLKNVFTIENSDSSIADAVISNTEAKDMSVAKLDSIQSVSSDMIDDGTTYLSIMRSNFDVLKEALN